jgi:hypothetical protein
MTKVVFLLTVLVTALVCGLPAAPAQAQAARTFVSATGSDSNSCASVIAPCRHFTAAYAATAVGGEIDVLDPANYGALTIGHSLSIEANGWAFVSATSGAAAITVTASAGDKINIRGVVLDGGGLANTYGIVSNLGGSLNIQNSVIRNFGKYGILFEPTASSILSVSNTLVSDNANHGIYIFVGGTGPMVGVLDRVTTENNSGVGLFVESNTTSAVNVTVGNSVSAHNTVGVDADSTTGGAVNVMIRNSTIANNTNQGLLPEGAGAQIWITRSTITGNDFGWGTNGGTLTSFADNNIVGNTNINTAPPATGYQ